MANNPEFQEWMVNSALFRYLSSKKEKEKRLGWLFDLKVDIGEEDIPCPLLKELCGFRWKSEDPDFAFDKGFKPEERGKIEEQRFKSTYWSLRPDFRFRTKDGTRQLFIEGKGGPPSRYDKEQAIHYLGFIHESGSTGALVYLVPEEARSWVRLLHQVAESGGPKTGVLYWDKSFLQQISTELLHVITESQVGPMNLLKKAMELRNEESTQ